MDVTIILDTNVICEIFAVGDLLHEREKHPTDADAYQDANFRSLQLRARCSLVLAWHFSEAKIGTGSLDEFKSVLTQDVAPHREAWAAAFTTTIAHRIKDQVFGGWAPGVLGGTRPGARGAEADDEIIRLATADPELLIITNEGVTPAGYSDVNRKGKPNLRGRARTVGIPVYSPKEYLDSRSVDLPAETVRLMSACEAAADRARSSGSLATWDAAHALTGLVAIYRFVLLDDVDPSLASATRPAIPWF